MNLLTNNKRTLTVTGRYAFLALWGLLCIPVLASASEGKTSGVTLTLKGKPKAIIVKPALATSRESFAALELQKYIREISGATLEIKADTDPVKGNVILIGGPARNRQTAALISRSVFQRNVPGPEGMMIKTFGRHALVLAGSSGAPNEYERGTVYAVYEFLEAYTGCSFAAYGKPGSGLGEYIPHTPTLVTGDIDYRKIRADLPYRTAIVQYFQDIPHDHRLGISFIDWLAKNRYNRINTMASVYEDWKKNGLLDEAKKRGILFTVGHHESSLLFLPPHGNAYFPEHYYTTHPEYYKLMADGTRFDPKTIWRGQWVFNSRNQGAINQMAANIKTWIARNPYVDVVCLWPCDGTAPQCTDSLCQGYSKVENYTYFVNEVAKKVNATYPDIKIDMLVYHDLWEYPDNMVLDSSLLIDQANITRTYGKDDGSCLLGSPFEQNAKKWASSGASVVYYEYYMGLFGRQQVYFPMADALDNIYRYFKSNGYCEGSGTQMECYNLWNFLFNFYMHGRTSYDTSMGMAKNLNRFCRIFGKGAPYVESYIRYVEHFFEGQGGTHPGKWFMEHVDKDVVYDYFEKAYQAQPEGKLRDNIRLLRMAFRYGDLYTNGGGDGELQYMKDHFDSYGHLAGYGLSVLKGGAGTFSPNQWYHMSVE